MDFPKNNELLLDWSRKQGYILTGGGCAEKFYTAERGFPFDDSQLPHYHLMIGDTDDAFRSWRSNNQVCALIAGVWNRPLFIGGFDHSSDREEIVFNTQTLSFFVDLRIPTRRPDFSAHRSLSSLSDSELRYFARQHCFAGYSLAENADNSNSVVVTRHHIIDWNYCGAKRTRPNKWRVEMAPGGDVWKEWSFAVDDFGQSYYMERWERRAGDERGAGRMLALRQRSGRDKLLLVVGNHFAFARGRPSGPAGPTRTVVAGATLFGTVDKALECGDRALAEALLALEGGHGLIAPVISVDGGAGAVSDGKHEINAFSWIVDAATHPWQEGHPCSEFLDPSPILVHSSPTTVGAAEATEDIRPSFLDWEVEFAGGRWQVLECSFPTAADLEIFLKTSRQCVSSVTSRYNANATTEVPVVGRSRI